ncbi:hypothetical protein A2U01_0067694, partial [Trifolium medium]|nr:hypothetical protein [Trifolium medium]
SNADHPGTVAQHPEPAADLHHAEKSPCDRMLVTPAYVIRVLHQSHIVTDDLPSGGDHERESGYGNDRLRMNVVVGMTQSYCDVVAVSDCQCRRSPVSVLSDVSVSP